MVADVRTEDFVRIAVYMHESCVWIKLEDVLDTEGGGGVLVDDLFAVVGCGELAGKPVVSPFPAFKVVREPIEAVIPGVQLEISRPHEAVVNAVFLVSADGVLFLCRLLRRHDHVVHRSAFGNAHVDDPSCKPGESEKEGREVAFDVGNVGPVGVFRK